MTRRFTSPTSPSASSALRSTQISSRRHGFCSIGAGTMPALIGSSTSLLPPRIRVKPSPFAAPSRHSPPHLLHWAFQDRLPPESRANYGRVSSYERSTLVGVRVSRGIRLAFFIGFKSWYERHLCLCSAFSEESTWRTLLAISFGNRWTGPCVRPPA